MTAAPSRQPRPGRRRSRHAIAAVALAAAVSTIAVESATANGAPEPAPQPVSRHLACSSLPRGLALTGNGPHRVWRVTRSGSEVLAGVTRGVITKAVRGRDGTIWVEARRASRPNGTWRWIVRIDPDGGRRTSETGDVRLSHVGAVGRRGRATVATYIDRDRARLPDDEFGGVYVECSNGGRRSVGIAGAPEYFVASAAPSVHRVAGTFRGCRCARKLSRTSPRPSPTGTDEADLTAVCSIPPTRRRTTSRRCTSCRSCHLGASSCRGSRDPIGRKRRSSWWATGSS